MSDAEPRADGASRGRLTGRELLFVAIEAPLFAYCVFRVTQAALFVVDGVYGRDEMLRDFALFIPPAFILVLAGALRIARRPWLSLVVDAAIFAFPALLLTYAAAKVPLAVDPESQRAVCFLFIPLEWHKLPRNIWLIMSAFPLYSAGVTGLVGVMFLARFRFGMRRLVPAVLVVLIVLVAGRISSEQLGERAYFFRVVFSTPIAILAIAALLGWPRFYARGSVLAVAFGVLYTFYTALTPLELGHHMPAGVEVLYPAPGESSVVPTEYLRDFYVEPDGETLFATYGPTSGLIRLDIPSGALDTLETEGLYRHFRTRASSTELYTVDWLYAQLLRVDKPSFSILDEFRDVRFLNDSVLIQPIDLEVLEHSFVVVSTEFPAISKYDRRTMRLLGQLDLWKMGITRFRSGAWLINRDPISGKLYVHVGMLDDGDRYAILRIDPESFEIDGKIDDLEAGGLTMIPLPGKRSLLLGDFYTKQIVEVDMDTMELRRSISAVLNTRSLAYDPLRDLIYAASFQTGEVIVIDYESGDELGRRYITKKPSAFFLDVESRYLYFGGSAGFLRVELAEFLADVAPDAPTLTEADVAPADR